MFRMARLGYLERAVMEALWAVPGAVPAREVAEALQRPDLAYTTVLTVLGRLERKGLLRRDKSAKAHTYASTASRADHVALLMEQALGQADDRQAVLQHFARSVSADDAAALRRALEGR